MFDLLQPWREEAAKLDAGEITQEEYDKWRYTYPEVKVQRTREALDALREAEKNKE